MTTEERIQREQEIEQAICAKADEINDLSLILRDAITNGHEDSMNLRTVCTVIEERVEAIRDLLDERFDVGGRRDAGPAPQPPGRQGGAVVALRKDA